MLSNDEAISNVLLINFKVDLKKTSINKELMEYLRNRTSQY
jgi:hypothetical protein